MINTTGPMDEQIQICTQKEFDKLLKSKLSKNHIVLCDDKLKNNPTLNSLKFSKNIFYLKAGEKTKSIEFFTQWIEKKSAKLPLGKPHVIVVGGGSLGDFGGFFARTYKRGCPLIHVPSTWLAACDSAIGGKNALNIKKNKNQLGTIYPAQEILINKELINQLDIKTAIGEFCKYLFLDLKNKNSYEALFSSKASSKKKQNMLEAAINVKTKIVKKDPYETKNIRHLLNLGHTSGHAFESHLGLNHSQSVLMGLFFTLDFSLEKDWISEKKYSDYKALLNTVTKNNNVKFKYKFSKNLANYLQKDKKRNNDKIHFPGFFNTSIKVIETPVIELTDFLKIWTPKKNHPCFI